MQRWHLQFRRFLSYRPLGKWKVFWEEKQMFSLFLYYFLSICWVSSRAECWARCILGADSFQSSLSPAFHTRPCVLLRGITEMKPEVSGALACHCSHIRHKFHLKRVKDPMGLPPRPTGSCILFSFSSQRRSLHLHGQGFSAGDQIVLECKR